jgi:hypothetical protein
MTWFRVEAALRDHKVLGAIAEELKVRPAEAAGLYILTLAGFAEHERSGRPELVTDTDLEGWARWQGRRGRFAHLFRSRLIETREGEKDPPGQIKGWWRQEALLREQERNRTRPGQHSRTATKGPRKGHGTLPERPRESPERATRDVPVTSSVPSRGNVVSTTLPERVEISVGSDSPRSPAGFALEGASPAPTAQEERQHRDRQRAGFHQAAHETPS